MERTQSIEQMINSVENDKVLLPEFQRDFVWELSKTYDLFDSIVKDIFIGAIIYGSPSFEIAVRKIDNRERLKKGKKRSPLTVQNLTRQEIADKTKLDKTNLLLVLDGQQRITSIYRAVKAIDTVWFIAQSESEIESDSFDKATLEDLLCEFSGAEDSDRISIKISDVWKMDADNLDDDEMRKHYFHQTEYYKKFNQDAEFNERNEFRKFRYLKKKIADLFKQEKLLSFYLLDMSLEKFVVFFERSNTRGIQLNFIDILAAKLYTGDFNLKKEIADFQSQNPNYDLTPEIIVRAIAYLTSSPKDVDRNYILTKLTAEDFKFWWQTLCDYYKIALDYLFNNNFIVSQNWMPYENMLIPLIVFLHEIGGDFHKMTQPQKEFLVFWYFNSVFSLRYSGSSNQIITEDSSILTTVAKNKKINSATFINKLTRIKIVESDDIYSLDKKGNALYKGVLNLINFHSKGLVDWSNDSKLSINSELEDHHIFPKAFLEKNASNADRDFVDCVGNRTLVPKKLNIKFSNKKPSIYLAEVRKSNAGIEKTLENHLISTNILTGDLDDDYPFFLEERIGKIYKLIQKYVVQPLQTVKDNFYEETRIDDSSTISVFGKYKKNRVEATFNPTTKKVFYKGQIFDSPSAAAIAVKREFGASETATENGWMFWKFINDNGEERKITEFR